MKEQYVSIRDRVNHMAYTHVLKPIFFQMEPEVIHERMIRVGRLLGSISLARGLTSLAFCYFHPRLKQTIRGVTFSTPIGLAAGFDKDAHLVNILPSLGFGFAEVGSITGEPCAGNTGVRLWRLKKSQGLVVYYGLKNEGCEKIAARLKGRRFDIPIGISIAKTNCKDTVELEAGIKDYEKAYMAFKNIGNYYTINISCPNTYGGEPFTDPDRLDKLLARIDVLPYTKPIFLKLSPDLSEGQVDAIVKVVKRHRVSGFICANLTKRRKDNRCIRDDNVPEKGGMSGKVVEDMSNNLIRAIYRKTEGKYTIIGCGGVFSAEDAYKKIRYGASLVQLITGMIFEGPQVVSQINQGLVRLLERDGFGHISEVVGVDIL
jgi:dihydroorotate dehydrogenase